jgi:hypothetical protein
VFHCNISIYVYICIFKQIGSFHFSPFYFSPFLMVVSTGFKNSVVILV